MEVDNARLTEDLEAVKDLRRGWDHSGEEVDIVWLPTLILTPTPTSIKQVDIVRLDYEQKEAKLKEQMADLEDWLSDALNTVERFRGIPTLALTLTLTLGGAIPRRRDGDEGLDPEGDSDDVPQESPGQGRRGE